MKIEVLASQSDQFEQAIADIVAGLRETKPSLIVVGFNTLFDSEALLRALEKETSCPIMGGSSCKGAFALTESTGTPLATLALLVIEDPHGNYGVGHREIGTSSREAAKEALEIALYASDRGYESPELVFCILPPGEEEDILEGFAEVIGPNVPVFGGSSADNEVSGEWQQLTEMSQGTNQICVAVLYPSKPLGASFSSGYQPTDTVLTATSVENRIIKSLNDSTAAFVYNNAANQVISEQLSGGKVLPLTTLYPLGRRIQGAGSTEDFLLSHPDAISEAGEIALFSRVEEGDQLYLMHGSKQLLLERAKRVINTAISLLPTETTPCGILMIYCAGCMLTVEDQLETMFNDLKQTYPTLPIFGLYTFGEQGCFKDGISRHGNLMISAVAFSQ